MPINNTVMTRGLTQKVSLKRFPSFANNLAVSIITEMLIDNVSILFARRQR